MSPSASPASPAADDGDGAAAADGAVVAAGAVHGDGSSDGLDVVRVSAVGPGPEPGAQESSELLQALFIQAPPGVYVLDTELRVVRYSAASPLVGDLDPERVIGHRLSESLPQLKETELESMARQVLEENASFRQHTVRIPGLPPQYEPLALAVSMFRLQGDDGRTLGLAAAVQDITDQQRAVERLTLLYRAHKQIGSTLDALTTAQELVDVLAPDFAELALVDLLDDTVRGRKLRPGPVGRAEPLRRAARNAVDRGRLAVDLGDLTTLPFPSPFAQAMSDLKPRLISRLTGDEQWLQHHPEHRVPLREGGVHSLLVLPLHVHGTALGLALAARARGNPEPFTEGDVELAAEIAGRAALSIDNAHRFAREKRLALELQTQLLPSAPPVLSGVETGYLRAPGQGVGSWYDVIPLSGGRVGLVVGELVGEGVEAAAVMGQLRTAVLTLSGQDLQPDELLAQLDQTVAVLERPIGASCCYLAYDPVTGACTAARAGRPGPLVVGPDGREIPLDVPEGPTLGTGTGRFESVRAELPPGSVAALFTDGLLGREGRAAMLRLMAEPGRTIQELCDEAAYEFMHARPDEDAVLLLTRVQRLNSEQVAIWTFDPEPSSAAEARRLVRDQLNAWGLDEMEPTTELIVSELVTNGIRYGRGPVRLRLIRDQTLMCEVSDEGLTSPHLRHARSTDEGGRGLFLVMNASQRWGTRFTDRGKTIWSEQPLPAH